MGAKDVISGPSVRYKCGKQCSHKLPLDQNAYLELVPRCQVSFHFFFLHLLALKLESVHIYSFTST